MPCQTTSVSSRPRIFGFWRERSIEAAPEPGAAEVEFLRQGQDVVAPLPREQRLHADEQVVERLPERLDARDLADQLGEAEIAAGARRLGAVVAAGAEPALDPLAEPDGGGGDGGER